jgi:hypothetical protein
LFAVAFVVGVLMISDTPDADASDAEWLDHYADSGNRWQIIVGAFILALATLGLLVFVSALRERLRDAPGAPWLSTAILASGVVLVAMIGVAGASSAAVPALVEIAEGPVPTNADVPRTLEQIGFGALLLFGMVAAGVMIGATSAAGGRAALLPRWLVVTGYVVAVLVLIGGVFFLPMALLVLWVLVISIILVREPRVPVPRAVTA